MKAKINSLAVLLCGLAIVVSPVSAAGGGSWLMTTSPTYERSGHTATLLGNGKILISTGAQFGIYGSQTCCARPELFDPQSKTWALAGDVNEYRQYHTDTLLPSGDVLLTGGYRLIYNGFLDVISGTEIYSPTTNAWTPELSMNIPRTNHTATLLKNGKVLLAGGISKDENNSQFEVSSAEAYNPINHAWTLVAPMNEIRSEHTATLLPSGKVLVAGGNDSALKGEVYDPETNTWQLTAPSHDPRRGHQATLLPDGRVLITGGYFWVSQIAKTFLSSAEIFDPNTQTWTLAEPMSMPRESHTATLLPNGTVLVTGGQTYNGQDSTALAEIFDPQTNTWHSVSPMKQPRAGHTATLLQDGNVLIVGGTFLDVRPINSPGAEIFYQTVATLFMPVLFRGLSSEP